MNCIKNLRTTSITLLCFIVVSMLCAADIQSPKAEIKVPMVELHRAGKYVPQLNEMLSALNSKQYTAYYAASETLAAQIRKIPDKDELSVEVLTALEWSYYCEAIAPVFPDASKINENSSLEELWNIQDEINRGIGHKMRAINCIYGWYIDIVPLRLYVDKKIFLKNRANYFSAYMHALNRYKEAIKYEIQEDEKARHKKNQRDKTSVPIESIEEMDKMIKQEEARLRTYQNRNAVRERIYIYCKQFIEQKMVAYIELMVHAYPNDRDIVFKNLKQLGVKNDMEIAILLEKTVKRSREYEYLFRGLPTEKNVKDGVVIDKKDKLLKFMKDRMTELPTRKRMLFQRKYNDASEKIKRNNTSLNDAHAIQKTFCVEVAKARNEK